MNGFQLSPQLQKDCFTLGVLGDSQLLLLDNALVPWFILVPRTAAKELFELDDETRLGLVRDSDTLAGFVKQAFACDKINVASIGNVVSQLHLHVIGRRHDDFCWPEVVWGRKERQAYSDEAVMEIVASLLANLDGQFVPGEP